MFAGFLIAFGFMPRRVHDSAALRGRILEAVQARLGITEARLQRETGLKRGTVRHHLRVLVDAGILRVHAINRQSHYFPAGMMPAEMERMSAATHGRAKAVLREIFLWPGIPQAELADRLGMTRMVLRRHLDLLAQHRLIDERRASRQQRYWPGRSADSHVYERVVNNPIARPPPARPMLRPDGFAEGEPGADPEKPADGKR